MENKFTQLAQNALICAAANAQKLGHGYIGSEHLLLGLIEGKESIASKMLTKRGISYARIREELEARGASSRGKELSSQDLTPRLRRIISDASSLCKRNRQELIGSEHLLYSLLCEEDCLAVRILEESGIYVHEMQNDILALMRSSKDSGRGERKRGEEKESAIEAYLRDLNAMYAEGKNDPTLCRERETDRLIQILTRRTKNNPCLIGEPGVGKTAVVEGLAARIVRGEVPPELRKKRICSLDLPLMIAGAKYRGEFEDRMKALMRECSRDPSVILFIDEIHTMIGAGGAEGAIDAANILKPALARSEIQMIGATTLTEYRKHFERDSALERRFQPITVKEPSKDDTIKILKGLRARYEDHHHVRISDSAIISAVELSERYIRDRYLPDKAIDLIDEASSRLRLRRYSELPCEKYEKELSEISRKKEEAVEVQDLERAKKLKEREITLKKKIQELASDKKRGERRRLSLTSDDIAQVVTEWSGIPVSRLLESENERLASLDRELKQRMIGQDRAIDAVANAIRRGRIGLKEAQRPTGSFIFIGPSGVGKTELCLDLAEALFGSRRSLIRFDMSEYTEKHSVSKLIGAPPGYVGYGESGLLTERVRREPYSLILFDEIEKAHPQIYDLMLQILDAGTLTDSQGRCVDFRNTLIIMTSNLGSDVIRGKKSLGFCQDKSESHIRKERKAHIEESLRAVFKPEFINRIDEIVIFEPLGRESIERISSLMLGELEERMAAIGIQIHFDESVKELIAERSFDERYGARNIRREIRRQIEDRISEQIVCGEIGEGDDILAEACDGEICFSKIKISLGG